MLLTSLFVLAAAPAPPQTPAAAALRQEAKGSHSAAEAQVPGGLRLEREARVYFDMVEGEIWARGRDYKARFGAEGIEFHPFLGSDAPRNYPLGLSLSRASSGGADLDLHYGGVAREGQDVVLRRAGLEERYHVQLNSVEQTFVLADLASRQDLELELAVATDLQAEARESGFAFLGPHGGVHVTRAVVFDADGRSMDLDMDFTGHSFRLAIPGDFLEPARLPITVDPVITTLGPNPAPLGVRAADVVSVTKLARFLVWEETFSASDHDVYMAKIGALLFGGYAIIGSAGVYIDNTAADWRNPSVAYNAGADSLLTAAEYELAGSNTEVWVRSRDAGSNSLGTPASIAASALANFTLPDVGGNSSANGSAQFAVVYEGTGLFTGSNILLNMVTASGVPQGQTSIAGSLDDERHPSISKASGHRPHANEQAWNVVWDSGSPGDHDIWGARIGTNGSFVDPPFPIVEGPRDTEFPSASTVLHGYGIEAHWLCGYINNDGTAGSRDLGAVTLWGSQVLTDIDLTAMLADSPAEDTSRIDVDSDGGRYGVTWNETWNGSLDLDVFVATLAPFDQGLQADEVLRVAGSSSLEWLPAISGVQGGPTSGSDAFTAVWEGISISSATAFLEAAVYEGPDLPTCMSDSICAASANSTGGSAKLMAYGSPAVSADNLAFTLMGLPSGQFGYMLMASRTGSVAISQGVLCLGAPQIRFTNAVLQSTPQGTVLFRPSLNSLPQGTVVNPGSTWYFQYWYRDANPQPVSNFTDALRIDFE